MTMTVRIKIWAFALLFVGIVTTFTADGATRDTGADLVRIATRFIENYSRVEHEAGDVDGMFIEDVVIPSVVNVVDGYKGKIPPVARVVLYRFLIAGKSMASEELSILAGNIYLTSPKQFCRDVSKLGKLDRQYLIRQAGDGLALSAMKSAKVKCV